MSHYPKNANGEHLGNVDIQVSEGSLGGTSIRIYSILDLPGSSYQEATGDLLLAVTTPLMEWSPPGAAWRSSKHIEELLEELKPPMKVEGLIRTAAFAGLAIVNMAERKAAATA